MLDQVVQTLETKGMQAVSPRADSWPLNLANLVGEGGIMMPPQVDFRIIERARSGKVLSTGSCRILVNYYTEPCSIIFELCK